MRKLTVFLAVLGLALIALGIAHSYKGRQAIEIAGTQSTGG
jgi:hypothetical protein